MRQCLMAATLTIMLAGPARAGLYHPAEPDLDPGRADNGGGAVPFQQFRFIYSDLLNVAGAPAWPDGQVRAQLDELKAKVKPGSPTPATPVERFNLNAYLLREKVRAGNATVEDRVNLGAYLIRLGQFQEATEVLEPAKAQDPRNFMVIANLATAYQMAGQMTRALDYLDQLRSTWPAQWPGLTKAQLDWYRQVESAHLNLVKLRLRESLGQPPGRAQPATAVDDLFGVRFVGDSGKYEPGKLAADQQAKLPKDAAATVQQLLTWMPADTRLYWLLGEVLNAQGDIDSAATIFDECVWARRFNAPDLLEHRQLVQEARAKAAPAADAGGTAGWMPDKGKALAVGGLAGSAFLVLMYLQIRQMVRRGRRTAAPGRP